MASSEQTRPPDPTIVETTAGPVEYVDLGAGAPVLFVHGSPGGCDQGALMAGFLAAEHRVVAISRPGYRHTPLTDDNRTPTQQADLAVAVMDALDIERFALVCWSGGGPASYLLAARRPERVSALVAVAAVSTAYEVGLKRRIGIAEEKLLMNRFGSWLAGKLTDTAPRTAVKMLLGEEGDLSRDQVKQLTAEVVEDEEQRDFALAVFDTVTGPRRAGFGNDLAQFAALELPLSEVAAPTLLLHATTDADVPYEHSVHADAQLPDSRLVTFDPGTHLSAWLGPESLGARAEVLAHLATHAP